MQSQTKRIRVSCKALIRSDENILVVEEQLKSGRVIWDLPGGGMDYGESPEEAVIREVSEEVGLVVQPQRVVGVYDAVLTERNNIQSVCIVYDAVCNDTSRLTIDHNPATEEMITAAHWLPLEKVIAADQTLRRVAQFLRGLE